jgi:hypothetical protein
MSVLDVSTIFHFTEDETEFRWDGPRLPDVIRAALHATEAGTLALAVVDSLLADTHDGGVCMAHQPDQNHIGIVGWRVEDYDDDERGAQLRQTYAPFAVVVNGLEAFPICEDCDTLLLAPRHRPENDQGVVVTPV